MPGYWFLTCVLALQPPTPYDRYQCKDVTILVPTIDADEEAMCEAMRSWVLNEPREIIIVTVENVPKPAGNDKNGVLKPEVFQFGERFQSLSGARAPKGCVGKCNPKHVHIDS